VRSVAARREPVYASAFAPVAEICRIFAAAAAGQSGNPGSVVTLAGAEVFRQTRSGRERIDVQAG